MTLVLSVFIQSEKRVRTALPIEAQLVGRWASAKLNDEPRSGQQGIQVSGRRKGVEKDRD
jgi:hypothetical protein